MSRASALAIALVFLGTIGLGPSVMAHHSYAGTYFLDKNVEVQGEIAVFMYRNPHSILQIVAVADDGKSYRWACEWAGTLKLEQGGVNRFTLKPGDKVTITGAPGRNADDHRLLVRSIQRPTDGWKWSGDSK